MKRGTIRKRLKKKMSYKRRRRQVGGTGEDDIRDILGKIRLDVFIASMKETIQLRGIQLRGVEYTRAELTLQSILPKFTTESALKNDLCILILLIGIISYHLRDKCTIIVKGGVAVQFLLAKHKCNQTYSTNDLDLFIQPENTKHSARECANIISYFLVGALTNYVEGDILAKDYHDEKNDKKNIVKISVKQANGIIKQLVDVGYSQQSIFTTVSTVVAEIYGIQFRYYVPTMEIILMEKLRNLYLLREKPEPYQVFQYKQSAIKSLVSLSGCIEPYNMWIKIKETIDALNLTGDERIEAWQYLQSLLQ
jgi:hypothetical protein